MPQNIGERFEHVMKLETLKVKFGELNEYL